MSQLRTWRRRAHCSGVALAAVVASLVCASCTSHALDGAPSNVALDLISAAPSGRRSLPLGRIARRAELEFENFQIHHPKEFDRLATSDCQLVPIIHLLKHPGCQLKAISSFACSGACPSYVQTSASKSWQHERSCSCCQQTGSQEATFTLDCPSLDPPYRKVKTHAPSGCVCRACTSIGRNELRPQELVEVSAGEVLGKSGTTQ